jgi:hypothetical protein
MSYRKKGFEKREKLATGCTCTTTAVLATGTRATAPVTATLTTTVVAAPVVTTRATVTATVATLTAWATVVAAAGVVALVGRYLVWRQVGLAEYLATHEPHLDADLAIYRLSFRQRVVDVSTQGVQRSATLFVLLGAGNFSATQTTTTLNLDAFSTYAHGGLNRHLHGATEGDTSL